VFFAKEVVRGVIQLHGHLTGPFEAARTPKMSGGRYPQEDVMYEKASERSRWPPLTRLLMSGDMSTEQPRELSMKGKFNRWMVNEGARRVYDFRR
jgi:hypothetical protein